MAKHFTEGKLLQTTETLFETLKTHEEITNELAEYTYDTEKIAVGKALYDKQETNLKGIKEEHIYIEYE